MLGCNALSFSFHFFKILLIKDFQFYIINKWTRER